MRVLGWIFGFGWRLGLGCWGEAVRMEGEVVRVEGYQSKSSPRKSPSSIDVAGSGSCSPMMGRSGSEVVVVVSSLPSCVSDKRNVWILRTIYMTIQTPIQSTKTDNDMGGQRQDKIRQDKTRQN